ncbi:hypothetical protein TIFTF001_020757 [Ficus carica]|uniref:Uncharacterized protein n=1 Tax=Ficus carica TaxID=3494 RepID=A0AA88AFJ2_FICCA|nr:hypothetical protein TIFTF001_020757 [Ficus carica]
MFQLSPGNLAMENRYGLFRQSSRVWRSLRDGDFEEEEVWSVLKDNRTDHSTSTKVVQSKESTSSSPSLSSLSVPRHVTTAARMIPRASRGGGGCDSSSSAGRTLKGRDLSKVRNAVLTKTGFLELL